MAASKDSNDDSSLRTLFPMQTRSVTSPNVGCAIVGCLDSGVVNKDVENFKNAGHKQYRKAAFH
jgi:hypothetical protein